MNLTAPCRHASCAKSAPPWRSAMPAPGLPNGGMRTWAGGATESPVANLEAPPDLILHAVRRMTFGHTDEEYNRAAQMDRRARRFLFEIRAGEGNVWRGTLTWKLFCGICFPLI